MSSHDAGDEVTVYHVFYDADGDPAVPDIVTLHVLDPATGESSLADTETADSGTDTDALIAAANAFLGTSLTTATGIYWATITPTSSGVWRYAWLGSGSVPASRTERWFDVKRQQVPAVSS